MNDIQVRVLLDTGPTDDETRRIQCLFRQAGMTAVTAGHSYGGPPPTSAFLIVVNAPLAPFLDAFGAAGGPGASGLAGIVRALAAMRADRRKWGRQHAVRLEDSQTSLAIALSAGLPMAAYQQLLASDLDGFDKASPATLVEWDPRFRRWRARLTTAATPISRRVPSRSQPASGEPRVRQLSCAEISRLWKLVCRHDGSAVTWQRARIVLLGSMGWSTVSIAQRTLVRERRVRAIVVNFNRHGFSSLAPGYADGEPAEPSVAEEREALSVMSRPPGDFGLDQPEWTLDSLTQVLVAEGVLEDADPDLIRSLTSPRPGVSALPRPGEGTPSQPAVHDILQTLLENEHLARRSLNMVPSENAMSGLAKLPLLLDTYHRYFFPTDLDDERWQFRGAQLAADIETSVTLPLLREMAGAEHVSVRPLSGLNAMTVVLGALGGPPGSTVVTVAKDNGGHYATPQIAARLGLEVAFIEGPDAHTADYAAAARLVAERRPAMIYIDQSNCLFPIDVAELVRHVRAVDEDVLIHVDVSHWMGLVLGQAFPNPLACGADSFGGSTHKTFPGPQKAVFCTNRADLAARFSQTQDYLISSHHFGASVSLGLALAEFRSCGGREYVRAILDNTRRFARHLHDRGMSVIAADRGFSAGHQIWLDTQAGGIPAQVAAERLAAAGIRVNFLHLPRVPHQAIRIGLNEPTYRGLTGADMEELAEIFMAAVSQTASSSELAARIARMRTVRRSRPAFPIETDPLIDTAIRLCLASLLDRSPMEVDEACASLMSGGSTNPAPLRRSTHVHHDPRMAFPAGRRSA